MEERVSRREALTKWAAVALGGVAAAVWPRKAEAANDDPIKIGQTNTGTLPTVLNVSGATSQTDGLVVGTTGPHDGSAGAPSAVFGRGFVGIRGISYGTKTYNGPGEGPMGVLGIYSATSTTSFGTAVQGRVLAQGTAGNPSDKGIGVLGESGQNLPSDLWWSNPANLKGIGVLGVGSRTGVLATSTAGLAMDVRGRAAFSRSGRGTIAAGRVYVDVVVGNLAWNSMMLVTLQGNPGTGRYVKYVQKLNATTFRVYLSQAAAAAVNFAWFVLN